MPNIKIGARTYDGVEVLKFPLSDGSGYTTYSRGGEVYEYEQTPTLVKNFLVNVTYDSSDYTTSEIANYAPSTADVNNTYPNGVDIDGTTYYNHVPNEYNPILIEDNKSATVKPTHFLRQIKCETRNVRDLGGWACDGGNVKYGKLFRGGEFQEADLDIFLNQLGISHELNLRGMSEAEENSTILRDHVGFTCPELYVWYTIADTYKEAWKEIIRCAFDCATENKPMYFHCSAGADRTGTVACILEAILGVSQSDMDKDYELTCFASGTSTDNYARRRNEADWKGLINQINALSVGTTFRDKVLNWVASLGFTVDEINAFRSAMINGTPDTITLNIGTQSITNTLTNVESNNDNTSIAKYQPYEAEISVQDGYAIESITVTMGGVDVTKDVFKGTPTNLYRAVTKNLTNCKLDNSKVAVISGQDYVANIVADDGYTIEGANITITMGGVDMAKYYSDGKIAIPNVTGDIVITANAVESASAVETVPITWKNKYTVGYSVGGACTESASDSYFISELIPVEVGKTYSFTMDAKIVSSSAFRFIGVNSSGNITEAISNTYTNGEQTFTYTPTSGTVGLRFRGYSSEFDYFSKVTHLVVE